MKSVAIALLAVLLLGVASAKAAPITVEVTVAADCWVTKTNYLAFRSVIGAVVVDATCNLAAKKCSIATLDIFDGMMHASEASVRTTNGRLFIVDGGKNGARYDVDLVGGTVTRSWLSLGDDGKWAPRSETGRCQSHPDGYLPERFR